jgi:Uma2 family endonuclease
MREPATYSALTYEDYLALERRCETTGPRHEFLRGEVWAMSGGTIRHAGVKTNLTAAVVEALRGSTCRAYDADLRIRVLATGLATYPDLSVSCGSLETHPEDPHAATNPVALFEVLSPSTEAWDRGGKFLHFQQITSLRAYFLVSCDDGPARVESYVRESDSTEWRYSVHGAEDVFELPGAAQPVPVAALFTDLPP